MRNRQNFHIVTYNFKAQYKHILCLIILRQSLFPWVLEQICEWSILKGSSHILKHMIFISPYFMCLNTIHSLCLHYIILEHFKDMNKGKSFQQMMLEQADIQI